jgi:hypothetical protein
MQLVNLSAIVESVLALSDKKAVVVAWLLVNNISYDTCILRINPFSTSHHNLYLKNQW